MRQCDWCTNFFDPAVSFQIYCSEECRTVATKFKQSAKAKERKLSQRKKKKRFCTNCNTLLSIYNDSKLCASCLFSDSTVLRQLDDIKRKVNNNSGVRKDAKSFKNS